MKRNEDAVFGVVSTNVHGSACEFEICPRKDWDAMSEEEQHEALIDAMWASGLVDVWAKVDEEN